MLFSDLEALVSATIRQLDFGETVPVVIDTKIPETRPGITVRYAGGGVDNAFAGEDPRTRARVASSVESVIKVTVVTANDREQLARFQDVIRKGLLRDLEAQPPGETGVSWHWSEFEAVEFDPNVENPPAAVTMCLIATER